ncbi:hypothetical protein [Sphingosinicella sp. BN140058]|uniref:hypothetical protein n=1 Tax=Sphingosinicella sp. BN140058 TaxID=1892855 RepID=UPI0010133295|nr:hypothetical protein [Sphingosinicella sp. BN140058]QAY75978.1 hypothetical protein ETR14_05130 [Sphingosinicella sp. BN140058]
MASSHLSSRPNPPPTTSAEALDATRPEVRRLLTAIPAFLGLPDEERKRIAADTVHVLSYMTDPGGVQAEIAEREANGELPRSGALAAAPAARALDESATEATKRQLAKSPGFAGKDFEAGAVRQGVEQFGEMVQKVDFPKFVGGLIKNVFQAIVESSIEQMRAYGELIANVAKTTDQFMRDNIGEAAGRDYLADAYPDVLSVDVGTTADGFADEEGAEQPPPRLQANGDNAAVRLAEISREMNINPPVTDLSDANAELRLVTAARLQMAKSRQQLLSSMVMLGINRIVVTDGSITAKVVFDMRASDKAKRHYTASMHDRESQKYKEKINAEYGSWYTPYSASASFEGEQEHVATVGSALDENSESKAEVKAKLSGEVRVNFKSDYLPMDKMATPQMMSVIQGNSTPYNPNTPPPAAGGG